MVSFFMSSAKAAGASGAMARPAAISATTVCSFSSGCLLRKIDVAIIPLSRAQTRPHQFPVATKLAFGSRFCENGVAGHGRRSVRRERRRLPKTNPGNFFEDFRLGQQIRHATPRTVTVGDVALYNGLFGAALCGAVVRRVRARRSAIRARRSTTCWSSTWCSARPCRTSRSMPSPTSAMPIAGFSKPVYPGDTLNAVSEVIGLKENSNRKTGIVYVRSRGFDETGETVLDYVRWVMVRKRDEAAPAPAEQVPELPKSVEPAQLGDRLPAYRCRRLTTPRWPAARIVSAITRPARRSTTSTASRSRRPSTRSRRGSIRTPRASISTSSPRAKAASAAG